MSITAVEALLKRRSIRAFSEHAPARPAVEKLIDAARHAPTARNVQPWEFVLVSESGMRAKLAKLIPNGPFIAQAPYCIIVLCQDTKYYLEDGCAATTNILNAAHASGFGACWVAGDKKEYAADVLKLLGVPAEFKLVSLIPVGFPSGNAPAEPPKRGLKEMIRWEKW